MKQNLNIIQHILIIVFAHGAASWGAGVPSTLSYQGHVTVNGEPFSGIGQFKFALIDGGANTNLTAFGLPTVNFNGEIHSVNILFGGQGYVEPPDITFDNPSNPSACCAVAEAVVSNGRVTTINILDGGMNYDASVSVIIAPPPPGIEFTTYWSNDGNSFYGAEPLWPVNLSVSAGLFEVSLGEERFFDTGSQLLPIMTAIPLSVFENSDVHLRVWFNDGINGFSQLTPDTPITATGYAMTAGQLSEDAEISSGQLADGSVTSAKIAPGAVQELGTPDGSNPSALQVTNDGLVGVGNTAPLAGMHISSGNPMLSLDPVAQIQAGDNIFFGSLDGASDVAVQGAFLAVAAEVANAVTFLDISDPFTPTVFGLPIFFIRDEVGDFINLAGPKALSISGSVLAVAARNDDAVTLVNIEDPAMPSLYSSIRDGVNEYTDLADVTDVLVSGNLLVVAAPQDNAVTLVDITEPSTPMLHSVLKDGVDGFNELESAVQLALSDNNILAIAAAQDDAVTLVDVTDPALPELLSVIKNGVDGYDSLDGPTAVDISGNLLAVATGADAVTLVDILNPRNPMKITVLKDGVGGFDYLGDLQDVTFSGGRLAITGGDSAVTLVDVSDPQNPALMGLAVNHVSGLHLLNQPQAVIFSGDDLVVVSQLSSGFSILRPTPRKVGLISDDWVGIGTTRPLAPLHVIGNVLVEEADIVSLETKGFSAGTGGVVSGQYSTTLGTSSKATGDSSIAAGHQARAEDFASLSMGIGTTASGYNAIALGFQTIAGGSSSVALGRETLAEGDQSMAMGYRAEAKHDGAFVWADEDFNPFSSTGPNQFLIQASGGVGINKNNPATALDVNGTITATSLDVNGTVEASAFSGNGAGLTNLSLNLPPIPDGHSLDAMDGTPTDALIVNNAGRVGIGTDEPESLLHVHAATASSANNTAVFSATALGPNYSHIHYGGRGDWYIRSAADDGRVILQDLDPAMRVGIGTSNPSEKLHVSGNILASGTITPNSDRRAKTAIESIDPERILDKVASLPIRQWRFKAEEDGVKHIGPMAQDFRKAFGLGAHETAIATVDADGVALAAIQGLNKRLEETLEENSSLKAELDDLKSLVNQLIKDLDGKRTEPIR